MRERKKGELIKKRKKEKPVKLKFKPNSNMVDNVMKYMITYDDTKVKKNKDDKRSGH